VIAFAIQTVIFDNVTALARLDPNSRNEVLAHNLVQSKETLIQPTPTVSLSPFSEPLGLTAVPLTGGELLIKWRRVESEIRSARSLPNNAGILPAKCAGLSCHYY
jgi:hypothetical protein